jgi:F-type H+-transporting ATPase subunit delta
MSSSLTLARPYARAAFSLARAAGQLPQWSTQLGQAAQLALDARVQALIGHPAISVDDAVSLVVPPGAPDPVFVQFLSVLADNGRLSLLPEIAAIYAQQRAEAERIVKAKITSATALTPTEMARLHIALRKRFGREIEITTAVNPDLIGGAVIDAGDIVIDGSIRNKLARLETALAH